MKYKIRRGSVGRALIPYRIKRPENRVTIRYKKIREDKNAREIKNLVEQNIPYDKIAKDLGLSKMDVLNIHNINTLRYGKGLTKTNIIDLIDRGVNTKEIGKFFNCKESKVIAIFKDIDFKRLEDIEIAIKVRDMREKLFDFKYIAQKIKVNRYKAFILYNNYFKIYDDNVLDMEIIDELIDLGLSNNDIATFYNVSREHILNIRKISEEIKLRTLKSKNNTNRESAIDRAYKSSNRDFYDLKMKNR